MITAARVHQPLAYSMCMWCLVKGKNKIIYFHFTKHANLQHLCAKIFVTRVCFTLGSSRHENKWDFNEHVKKVVAVYSNESKINFVSIKRQSEHSHKLIKCPVCARRTFIIQPVLTLVALIHCPLPSTPSHNQPQIKLQPKPKQCKPPRFFSPLVIIYVCCCGVVAGCWLGC